MQKHGAEETAEAAETHRASARAAMHKHRKDKQQITITLEESAAIFMSKIAEEPIMPVVPVTACTTGLLSLRRRQRGILQIKPLRRYSSTAMMYKYMENLFVCYTCHCSLKRRQVPTQSWVNGLLLDQIPPELVNLRPMEVRLISQRIPFMKLMGLPKGGQKAIHGSAVNVPAKLQSLVSLLPRLPATSEVVPLKLKRKLSYKGHYMHE